MCEHKWAMHLPFLIIAFHICEKQCVIIMNTKLGVKVFPNSILLPTAPPPQSSPRLSQDHCSSLFIVLAFSKIQMYSSKTRLCPSSAQNPSITLPTPVLKTKSMPLSLAFKILGSVPSHLFRPLLTIPGYIPHLPAFTHPVPSPPSFRAQMP